MSDLKTKKLRKRGSNNKKKLWEQFDNDVGSESPLECVYSSIGPREKCECCESTLLLTEEGFPACSNRMCGVIYTDTLDQSAEWRYYGIDD